MSHQRKQFTVQIAATAVVVVAICLAAGVWSGFRHRTERDQQRSRLFLIGSAIREYSATHGRFPLPSNVSSEGTPAVSWRASVTHICQDITRKTYRSWQNDGELGQAPAGWPFVENTSLTSILAVVREHGPWDSRTHSSQDHSSIQADEIIALSCRNIFVDWDSSLDIYLDHDGVWLRNPDSSEKKKVKTLRDCFILRMNGVVEYYGGTSDAIDFLECD